MLLDYKGKVPRLGERVFIAEGAKIIGDVEIGDHSSVWFNTVIRGDVHYIRIGKHTNIQDLSILHVMLTGIYVVLVRAMLLPTYWLARLYEWPQPRFGGLVGSSPFIGYVALPLGTAAFWILASLIFGGILGSLIIAVGRRWFR